MPGRGTAAADRQMSTVSDGDNLDERYVRVVNRLQNYTKAKNNGVVCRSMWTNSVHCSLPPLF